MIILDIYLLDIFRVKHRVGKMGSGEDAQFVFAKYDYTAQGNQVSANINLQIK